MGSLLDACVRHFTRLNFETPRLDAEVLLAHVLQSERIDLYMAYDQGVSDSDRSRYREMARQRAEGCPAAYLVGRREFYRLQFDVDPRVLIPRPETEHLVMAALDVAAKRPVSRFADIGTGSGAIAITLASEWPDATGIASDISPDALAVAKANAAKHGVDPRIEFLVSDVFEAYESATQFDLIVANPPYVADSELESLAPTVRDFEPRIALTAGPEGLDVIGRIVEASPMRLALGGALILEIGANQESAARSLFNTSPNLKLLPTIRDLARLPRALVAIHESTPTTT